jgi:two-component system, NtrC family, response regulator HydG
VNVRLVSATNRPLEAMVESGDFRNDLYFRLKVVTVTLPPLRERRDDIIPLMDHFRKQFLKRHSKPAAHFSPAVTKRFFAYGWPGNIRQLRNFVETMVVLDTDSVLDLDDLPPELLEGESQSPAGEPKAAASTGELGLLGQPLADIEKWAILETLKLTGGNRDEAAKVLMIGSRTLYRRLDQYKKDDGDDSVIDEIGGGNDKDKQASPDE